MLSKFQKSQSAQKSRRLGANTSKTAQNKSEKGITDSSITVLMLAEFFILCLCKGMVLKHSLVSIPSGCASVPSMPLTSWLGPPPRHRMSQDPTIGAFRRGVRMVEQAARGPVSPMFHSEIPAPEISQGDPGPGNAARGGPQCPRRSTSLAQGAVGHGVCPRARRGRA